MLGEIKKIQRANFPQKNKSTYLLTNKQQYVGRTCYQTQSWSSVK